MNIQDFKEKFKSAIRDDGVFTVAVLLLVGVTSFGLGWVSVAPEAPSTQSAAVIMTKGTETSSQTALESQKMTVEGEEQALPGKYVGSKNSTKYHLPWCSGAQRITEANKIWFRTEEEAKAAGYTPAANCPELQ